MMLPFMQLSVGRIHARNLFWMMRMDPFYLTDMDPERIQIIEA